MTYWWISLIVSIGFKSIDEDCRSPIKLHSHGEFIVNQHRLGVMLQRLKSDMGQGDDCFGLPPLCVPPPLQHPQADVSERKVVVSSDD